MMWEISIYTRHSECERDVVSLSYILSNKSIYHLEKSVRISQYIIMRLAL